MDDATFARQVSRVEAMLDRWMPVFAGFGWRISYDFLRTEGECSAAATNRAFRQCGQTAAKCVPLWEYLVANITFLMPEIAKLSDDLLEQAILHELAHVFLSGMPGVQTRVNRQAMLLEERTATVLALLFQRSRDHWSNRPMSNHTLKEVLATA